jgi:IK cytokine
VWRRALRTCRRLLRLQRANEIRPSRQILPPPIAANISAGVCRSGEKSAAPTAATGATKSLNKHAFRKPKGGGPQTAKGGKEKKVTEEQDTLNSILKNYRDRAKERRTVEVKTDIETEAEIMKLAGGYRAVAPVGAAYEQHDRRKQMIDESKYLGGDMEHTHLVKGLDYALLQKVRSELVSKEFDNDDEQMDTLYERKHAIVADDDHVPAGSAASVATSAAAVDDKPKTAMARNLCALVTARVDDRVVANEMFAPRRMAYVIDLTGGDDWRAVDSDIPTTLVRSKAECPLDESTTTSLSVNDVVIQKLSQVLSYLRADTKRKKAAKDKMIAEAAKIDPAQRKKDAAVK